MKRYVGYEITEMPDGNMLRLSDVQALLKRCEPRIRPRFDGNSQEVLDEEADTKALRAELRSLIGGT